MSVWTQGWGGAGSCVGVCLSLPQRCRFGVVDVGKVLCNGERDALSCVFGSNQQACAASHWCGKEGNTQLDAVCDVLCCAAGAIEEEEDDEM